MTAKQGNRTNLKRPRKRNRRRPAAPENSTNTSDNDVLEQLARQRARQQQQPDSADEPQSAVGSKPAQLGNFRYDEKLDTYFPINDANLPPDQSSKDGLDDESDDAAPLGNDLRHVSLPWLISQRSATLSMSSRRQLSWDAASKAVLSAMNVIPNSTVRGSGGHCSFFEGRFENDIDCKLHSPRWARTFDVYGSDFVSLVGDRAVLYSRAQTTSMYGCTHVKFLGEGRVGVIQKEAGNRSSFGVFGTQTTIVNLFEIPRIANDFCNGVTPGTVILATSWGRAASKRGPWVVSLEPGRSYRMDVTAPDSDSLCIDNWTASTVVLGHRNGSLSWIDARRRQVASTAPRAEFGGIINVQTIANGNQVLCRGYSGYVRLFDARKLSSSPSSLLSPSEMVYEFRPPPGVAHERLTGKCSGVVTDPGGATTLISPLVSHEDEIPCLGVWSLQTGNFLGTRPLTNGAGDDPPANSSWGISWVEVCPRVSSSGRRWICDELSCSLDPISNSWGLWYKCGQSIVPTIGPWGGSIHHVCVQQRATNSS